MEKRNVLVLAAEMKFHIHVKGEIKQFKSLIFTEMKFHIHVKGEIKQF